MFENVFSAADVQDFKVWMDWADRFVILTHIGPDGDAIGSSLALCHYLQDKGKTAVVITPDKAPDFLSWMPGFDSVRVFSDDSEQCESLIYKADVLCCLDFNVIGRIDKVAASFLFSKARKMLLDHHPQPGPNWDLVLSHPEASSTSELVFHLLCALGDFKCITSDIATCIYTGIMTDTGCFAFSSSDPSLFTVVNRLLEVGIDKDGIYRKVFYSNTENRIRMQGYVLSEKLEVLPGASTALITLSDTEMKRFGSRKGDTEGFVNIPLQIQGVLMSVFLREDKQRGIIRLSARSVGSVPCNRFASDYFGGGGHLNAAGGEIEGTLAQAVERFRQGMDEWSRSNEECIMQLFNNKHNDEEN